MCLSKSGSGGWVLQDLFANLKGPQQPCRKSAAFQELLFGISLKPMNPVPERPSDAASAPEALPLSLLNDLLYCPRRAALKAVEGWRAANEHTARGDIVHEHADLPGYEVAKGVTVLRALPVWSERLGLSGKCDVVEARSSKVGVQSLKSEGHSAEYDVRCAESKLAPAAASGYESLAPVEYKKGKRRAFENDDAQLCAQGLCLEEMFGVTVERGAVFHAASKRRREVEFTAELRQVDGGGDCRVASAGGGRAGAGGGVQAGVRGVFAV